MSCLAFMARVMLQILNFSIAYGKTAHGLAKDFGTTLAEAEHTVALWYRDRPEVLEWQKEQRRVARERGMEMYNDPVTGQELRKHGKAFVTTMTGRRRYLGDFHKKDGLFAKDKWMVSRFERMAINTPIQGSAADIASLAMLAIVKDKVLQELNWKLLLQVRTGRRASGGAEGGPRGGAGGREGAGQGAAGEGGCAGSCLWEAEQGDVGAEQGVWRGVCGRQSRGGGGGRADGAGAGRGQGSGCWRSWGGKLVREEGGGGQRKGWNGGMQLNVPEGACGLWACLNKFRIYMMPEGSMES